MSKQLSFLNQCPNCALPFYPYLWPKDLIRWVWPTTKYKLRCLGCGTIFDYDCEKHVRAFLSNALFLVIFFLLVLILLVVFKASDEWINGFLFIWFVLMAIFVWKYLKVPCLSISIGQSGKTEGKIGKDDTATS